jgi:predicted aldo/keto reductase-like oxidoreductase
MGRQTTSRRRFLKDGAAGVAGVALLTGCSRTESSTAPRLRNGRSVARTLGRTGLKLPVVSMGSCYAVHLVQTALDEGIVYIHTSPGYGENNHEKILGEVFQGRDRDSFVIATSPDLPYDYAFRRGRSEDVGTHADPSLIEKSLDQSLARLKVDAVDIFYLCSVATRRVVEFEPYLEAYDRLKKAGKAHAVGVGTHENEPEVIRAAAEGGFWDVVLTAYNFRQSHREEVGDAIAQAAGAGLGVVAMKTQAGVYWDHARTRMINMKAALKWVLQDENVHTAIPAISTYDELREDLSIMKDLAFTPEERRDLNLGDELSLAGVFCQQCGWCVPQCRAGVDVSTWMRASMYAVGHGSVDKAKETLKRPGVGALPCSDCSRCAVQCALGLDVRANALELANLLDIRA